MLRRRKRVTKGNPFHYTGPVPTTKFVGRKEVINRVFDWLLNEHARMGMSIYGEPGMGKTSLLQYISDPVIYTSNGLSPERHLVYHLDCRVIWTPSPGRSFWSWLFKELRRRLKDDELKVLLQPRGNSDIATYDDVVELWHALDERELVLVLMLDEFDALFAWGSDIEKNDTKQLLKELANFVEFRDHPEIARVLCVIIATTLSLEVLCKPFTIPADPVGWAGTPFPSVFRPEPLTCFTEEEVNELIDHYLEGTDIEFTKQDRTFVYEVLRQKGYPKCVQRACHRLFEEKCKLLA
jgi:hypothetical protein